jgi:hypothetical protein
MMRLLMSLMISSRTKVIAASGVLKAAARPAEAPITVTPRLRRLG